MPKPFTVIVDLPSFIADDFFYGNPIKFAHVEADTPEQAAILGEAAVAQPFVDKGEVEADEVHDVFEARLVFPGHIEPVAHA